MALPSTVKVFDNNNPEGTWRTVTLDVDLSTYATNGQAIDPKDLGFKERVKEVRLYRLGVTAPLAALTTIPFVYVTVANLIAIQVFVLLTGLELGSGLDGSQYRLVVVGR